MPNFTRARSDFDLQLGLRALDLSHNNSGFLPLPVCESQVLGSCECVAALRGHHVDASIQSAPTPRQMQPTTTFTKESMASKPTTATGASSTLHHNM